MITLPVTAAAWLALRLRVQAKVSASMILFLKLRSFASSAVSGCCSRGRAATRSSFGRVHQRVSCSMSWMCAGKPVADDPRRVSGGHGVVRNVARHHRPAPITAPRPICRSPAAPRHWRRSTHRPKSRRWRGGMVSASEMPSAGVVEIGVKADAVCRMIAPEHACAGPDRDIAADRAAGEARRDRSTHMNEARHPPHDAAASRAGVRRTASRHPQDCVIIRRARPRARPGRRP
jgi:hypothetical protein